MGLWDRLKAELIDIIEWPDPTPGTIVHRFERYGNEIKWGAKLIVREGQSAALVKEGQLADVYQPGTYTLETKNMPILSTLMGWKYGFASPFKAEAYFVVTTRFTDLKWGTMNPIMLRDAEFGPVRLRSYGTYEFRVKDPVALLRQVVGTDSRFNTDEIADQLRNVIVSRFADVVGESKIPVLDLAANYEELGNFLKQRISPDFEGYGLELTKLLVENVSLPPEVEQALDKRTSMGVIGNLAAYTQFQTANAIGDAAKNPSGMAGGGMAMGAGFVMANQLAQGMTQPGAPAAPGAMTPPPLPQTAQFFVAINGQQAGPFDVAALQQHVSGGRLTRETLVWRAGMPQWTPAGQVTELSSLLAAPPPLPQ
ncbi:MAG: SPFH domain-containing protein [Phycisphaerae bacterium]